MAWCSKHTPLYEGVLTSLSQKAGYKWGEMVGRTHQKIVQRQMESRKAEGLGRKVSLGKAKGFHNKYTPLP